MSTGNPLLRLLTSLRGGAAKERDLDDELAVFLELSVNRHLERGLDPDHARRAARLELGGLEQVKEQVRDAWARTVLDSSIRDLRYALRALRKNPAFAAVAVLTLALGIGANTAIFSLVHAVLLQPLPYDEPDRLALVWFRFDGAGQSRNPASGPELLDLRERSRIFDDLDGIWASAGTLTGDGDPEQVRVAFVTAGFFDTLGARPALGRSFLEDEEGSETPGAILLSDSLWRRRYNADAAVLGATVLYDGEAVTVVGILPPRFELQFPPDAGVPAGIQVWLPFAWDAREMPRDLSFIRVLGRMRPDVTVAQAREDLGSIAGQLRSEFPRYAEVGLGLDVVPLQDDLVREIRPALLALLGSVALVLLIACVNVANLQLARFGARRKEIAMRSALGASRARIARQLLIESLLLALVGGAAGVGLGWAGLRAMLALRPPGLEQLASVGLSAPVLGFTFVVAVLTGILFGLAPLLEAGRVAPMETLRKRGRTGSTPARERFRGLLVTAEVALGCLLLIGAGLMIRTLLRTLDASPGFRPGGALTFQTSLPRARYPDDIARAHFTRQLTDSIAAVPGVESAGAASHLPLDDYSNWYGFAWLDGATEQEKNSVLADQRATTPGYLTALGATQVEGRDIQPADDEHAQRVVVIDDTLARTLWLGESAIGRGLNLEAWDNGNFVARRMEVIGVVRHVQHHSLTVDVRGQAYLPHAQNARPVLTYVVRASGDPALLARPIAARLHRLDADLPMARVRPLQEYVDRAAASARFTAALAGIFAAAALLLASVGVYGVLAYAVEQRAHEIGVRLAMGARPGQILRLVVGSGLRTAVVGLALGLIGAVALGRSLGGPLYGVTSTDPMTYGVVSALLLAVTLLASWLPARRAARVDPGLCLRAE